MEWSRHYTVRHVFGWARNCSALACMRLIDSSFLWVLNSRVRYVLRVDNGRAAVRYFVSAS